MYGERAYEQEEHQRAEHKNESRRQDWPARVGHHSRCTAQKAREVVLADEALQIQKVDASAKHSNRPPLCTLSTPALGVPMTRGLLSLGRSV